MKPRHKEAYRVDARAFFQNVNIRPDQDFHTLSSAQVDLILKAADAAKYRKPKNANGSRARYFFQLMQRMARAA